MSRRASALEGLDDHVVSTTAFSPTADAPTTSRRRVDDLSHLRRGMAGPVELARRERVDRVLPGVSDNLCKASRVSSF
jgi:hypothetical protein